MPESESDSTTSPSWQKSLLAGIRVLDCSQFVPGPYATLLLADMGAQVIKVEPPQGDPLRYLGRLEADGISAAYKLINRNKTVVEIDLKAIEGADLFRQLLAKADILFESYRPGAFARLGLDSSELKKLNNRLIHVALTGYGQTGSYKLRSGHDLNYVALAGMLAQSGLPDAPMQSTPPVADFAGGQQAALMVSAALFMRQRTGVGLFIDLSMSEAVLAWQSIYLTESTRTTGGIKRGDALLNGGAAFYQIYRTRDNRFVTLAALEMKFWRNFCYAVGRADWVERQSEPLPQTVLTQELAHLFLQKDLSQWMATLETVDCCFEPVHELSELSQNSQIQDRGILQECADISSPSLEVLFPACIEGQPPAKRSPLRSHSAKDVLDKWQANG